MRTAPARGTLPVPIGLLLILLWVLIDSRPMTPVIALCAAAAALSLYGVVTHRRIPHPVRVNRS
jgi:hypothetical protein